MDDALVLIFNHLLNKKIMVLILVVMDDALVLKPNYFQSPFKQKS